MDDTTRTSRTCQNAWVDDLATCIKCRRKCSLAWPAICLRLRNEHHSLYGAISCLCLAKKGMTEMQNILIRDPKNQKQVFKFLSDAFGCLHVRFEFCTCRVITRYQQLNKWNETLNSSSWHFLRGDLRHWRWVSWVRALWDLDAAHRRKLDAQWIPMLSFGEETQPQGLYLTSLPVL